MKLRNGKNIVMPQRKPLISQTFTKEAEIAALKKIIAELKEEIKEYERIYRSEYVELNLWSSGLEDLCYHFGYCSDVMGDCWFPLYEEKGLNGLKKYLRSCSKQHHKEHDDGKKCAECDEVIYRLHD